LAYNKSLVGLNQIRTRLGSVIYDLIPKTSYKELHKSDNLVIKLSILVVLILLRF
jgi:hypothetical protein